MDFFNLLKGPAEVVSSKRKAFKNYLDLATDFLTHKDYYNAEVVYGTVLSDFDNNCVHELYNLNELDVFSLHTCFLYSQIARDCTNEEALVILHSLETPIKLPLISYLKAYIHISTFSLSSAIEAINSCQNLLDKGYNFKPNNILNEEIVPEICDEFLKRKLNGLRVVCDLIKAKEAQGEIKQAFVQNLLHIGELTEVDFINDMNKAEARKKETKNLGEMKPTRTEIQIITTGEKEIQCKPKMNSIALQTNQPQRVDVGVQTNEKEINKYKELLSVVLDTRNKVNNLQNKKDEDIKKLQKRNNELSDKLLARDNKRQQQSSEFSFLKEQYLTMEKKLQQSQKQVEILKKLLVEQMQQKYNIQKNSYILVEEKCTNKLDYFNEILEILKPGFKISPNECKHEMLKWKNLLQKTTKIKKDFENYYNSLNNVLSEGNFSSINTNDWPETPTVPLNTEDLMHRHFRDAIETYNSTGYNWPQTLERYKDGNIWNFSNHNSSQLSFNYHIFNEDGRTTGSPHESCKEMRQTQSSKSLIHASVRPQKESTVVSSSLGGIRKPFSQSETVANTSKRGEIVNQESEEEVLQLLNSNFKDVDEWKLLQVVYQIRDSNNGTLIGISKNKLINDIKKLLKKGKETKVGWNNISNVKWQNAHTDDRCCICFEDFTPTSTYTLSCQHAFHKTCIKNWLKRQSACPVCRVHAVLDEEFPPLRT